MRAILPTETDKIHTFSHQGDFANTMSCDCGGTAPLAFVAYEDGKKEGKDCVCGQYIVSDDTVWPHDCIAVAVYICTKCMKPIANMNQV